MRKFLLITSALCAILLFGFLTGCLIAGTLSLTVGILAGGYLLCFIGSFVAVYNTEPLYEAA